MNKFIDPERCCWLTSQSIIDNSDRIKMINQQIAADDLEAWLKEPPELYFQDTCFRGDPYYAYMARKCNRGGALDVNKLNPYKVHEFSASKGGSMYSVDVMAETEEEAVKKASDYLAKYRAEKEGL